MPLKDRIDSRTARVGVIGLGYVGLPLAVEFARAGFDVTGFDVDRAKVAEVNAGRSYIPDVPCGDVADLVGARRLRATADMALLAEMDVVDICVPTPLRKTKDPDMSYVELLHRRGARLSYTDPYVPTLQHGALSLTSVPQEEITNGIDCALVCTDHRAFDYPSMAARFPLVVDTRNALKGIDAASVFRL